MRKLSDSFMNELQTGFLKGLTEAVKADRDLDLHIRDNYLNIYFKGNSLLKLSEVKAHQQYKVEIHPKFLTGLAIQNLTDEATTIRFLEKIPALKANIIKYGQTSLETEYEQLIIRANNNEPRNTSEYFIVDRQYIVDQDRDGFRFDLMGFFWSGRYRRKGQVVAPCLMEVKFALNTDISKVHEQISRYYQLIQANVETVVEGLENVFYQRLALGLYHQAESRLEAMKTLTFSRELDKFQFIVVLVDYNPFSSKLDLTRLGNLPFSNQVKVFATGFAMWEQNLTLPNSL